MFLFGEPFHKFFLCISLVPPMDSLVLKDYSYHILNLESDIASPLIKSENDGSGERKRYI
jgi:hypothetical protein